MTTVSRLHVILALCAGVLLTTNAHALELGLEGEHAGSYGELRGTVVSESTDAPLEGVEITVESEAKKEHTRSDQQGKFALKLLPGSYKLIFFHASFDERTFLNVDVKAGKIHTANVKLTPGSGAKAGSLEEIVVTGKYLETSEKQMQFSESVVDVLTNEDWATTGDSDVTGALGRVSGVTIVDDKFVYVRGLGERYSSTLFNNALLPSPDPARRVIPLDLFPSAAMQELQIQKTYSPYLPADFSGGSVQLQTLQVPAELDARLSASVEYNSESTGKNKLWYKGDNADWTGFEGGFRRFPDAITDLSVDGRLPPPALLSPDLIRAVGLSLNRSYDEHEKWLAPNVRVEGSYGNSYETPIGTLGFLAGGRYKNAWQYLHEERRTTTDRSDEGLSGDEFIENRTVNGLEYAGLVTGEWVPSNGQSIKGTAFYTRVTDKRYIEDDGHLLENDKDVQQTTYEWEEQQLWTTQLAGQHLLDSWHDLLLDWGVTYSQAERDKPDSRFYEYESINDQFVLSSGPASNFRQWENLQDDAWDVYLDAEMPFKLTDMIHSLVKVGTKFYTKDRDSDLRRFRYNWRGSVAEFQQIRKGTPGEIWADQNIGDNKWELEESTQFTDSYSADEDIVAGFLQTDTDLGADWHLMAGFRYEESEQRTKTRAVQGGDPIKAKLQKGFWLPAATLTWSFYEGMQLRAGYSQTINRPDIREISLAPYLDAEDRDIFIGNPDLQIAEIQNYDLRWEWYYRGVDNMQLAGFYKTLDKPIEEVLLLRGGGVLRTYENAKDAKVYGGEFAIRQGFDVLSDWTRDFYAKFNGSLIRSEVTVPETAINQTNEKRRLQGQSNWVVNAQLTYDNLFTDSQATLAFNMFGPRIRDVGVQGFQDAKERSVPSLDFVVRQGFPLFGEFATVRFRAKNLLDPNYIVKRETVVERKYKLGRYFELALTVEF